MPSDPAAQLTGVDDASDPRPRWRAEVLPGLRGVVLDLGAGLGQAADHLDASATWIALEPARYARTELGARVAARPGARLLRSRAEHIPLPEASVDAVIASTVLCSVRDQRRVLAEVVRVLRPGGRMVFYEHVIAPPHTWSRFAQRVYAPISRLIDAGCDPARDTAAAIRTAGFTAIDIRETQRPGPLHTIDPHIHGSATR